MRLVFATILPVFVYALFLSWSRACEGREWKKPSDTEFLFAAFLWVLNIAACWQGKSLVGVGSFSIGTGFLMFQSGADLRDKTVWVLPSRIMAVIGLILCVPALFGWGADEIILRAFPLAVTVIAIEILVIAKQVGKGDFWVVLSAAFLAFPAKGIIDGISFTYGVCAGCLILMGIRLVKIYKKSPDAAEKLPMVPAIAAGVLFVAAI